MKLSRAALFSAILLSACNRTTDSPLDTKLQTIENSSGTQSSTPAQNTQINFNEEVAYLTRQCLAATRGKSNPPITRIGYKKQPLRNTYSIEGAPVGFFSNTSRQSISLTYETSGSCHISINGLGVNTSRGLGSAQERELYDLVFSTGEQLGYSKRRIEGYAGTTEYLVRDGFRTKVISSVEVSHGQRSTEFYFWSWGT
ncbi:hypothetical protein [Halocynthiibacter namhaensis]|uniref:hypothetical protein n=1 Tax=Halocynthiibacter namhaensis TaxID=1290553 RepID=UPI000578E759|nr:hypothetical protein [Halocynthiibacter namhaensis]